MRNIYKIKLESLKQDTLYSSQSLYNKYILKIYAILFLTMPVAGFTFHLFLSLSLPISSSLYFSLYLSLSISPYIFLCYSISFSFFRVANLHPGILVGSGINSGQDSNDANANYL